jgi:DNA-binding MarR family transcriptional regulator
MLNKSVLGGVLLVLTVITLVNSVDHHRHIAEAYGPIANIFVPTIALGSFLLGGFVSLFFQWGISEVQFEMVVKLLPAKEALLARALFDRRRITQAELSSETGLSRVMVSRILSSLEAKGVVARRPHEGTNLIESRLYRTHPAARAFTRLPGLSEERVAVVVVIVFMFGILFSLLNSFHVLMLEHPLEASLYLLAIEFFAIGAAAVLLLRRKLSDIQLEGILAVLPEDERGILRIIHLRKSLTQKELVEAAGTYKMKVSRIVRKFEERGVIEKRQYGYTNLIRSRL